MAVEPHALHGSDASSGAASPSRPSESPSATPSVQVLAWDALDATAQRATRELLSTVLGPYSAAVPHEHGTFVALDDAGAVVGAISATRPDLERLHRRGVCELAPTVCADAALVGELHAIAVAPHARRRGVARHLVTVLEAHLRAAGLRIVLAVAWVRRDDRPDARRVLAALGYHDHGHLERFWFHAGPVLAPDDPGAVCPDCGAPCRCTAAIMTHALC
jgi:GNAT superfamily N-acetyltransferase